MFTILKIHFVYKSNIKNCEGTGIVYDIHIHEHNIKHFIILGI